MNQYFYNDHSKDISNNNNYYGMGGILGKKNPYKYVPKANKKDPLVDQSRRIIAWLKDMPVEDRARAISVDNHSWLCVLMLKIFWISRLKNFNAFSQKPDEKLENLTKLEYKLKPVDDYLRTHKLNTSDFAQPLMPAQRTNRCQQLDAERRLFNCIRFCYNNEPYDTMVMENRSINEIDTTIAIFEAISDGCIFRTDLTKISDEVTDENNFFPDWFNIRSLFDINKILLASLERSILIKFKNNISKFSPTTYSWDTRNLVLNYQKGSDELFKSCIIYLKEITPVYAEWFKNEDEFREYNIEEVIKKYPVEKTFFLMVYKFSCFSGVRDLKTHERLMRELVMYLQSGEATTLIDSMLYQSFEECGRLRSIIFRRLGRFLVDKIFDMRILDVADEIEKEKAKKPKKRKRNKKPKNQNEEENEKVEEILEKDSEKDDFVKEIDQELLNFSSKKTFEIDKYLDKDLLVKDDDAINNEEIFVSKKKQRKSSSEDHEPVPMIKEDKILENVTNKKDRNQSKKKSPVNTKPDSQSQKHTEKPKDTKNLAKDIEIDSKESEIVVSKIIKKTEENSADSLKISEQEVPTGKLTIEKTLKSQKSEKVSENCSKKEPKTEHKKNEDHQQTSKRAQKVANKKKRKLEQEIKKANEVVICTKVESKDKSLELAYNDSKNPLVNFHSNTNKSSKVNLKIASREGAPITKQYTSKIEKKDVFVVSNKNYASSKLIKITPESNTKKPKQFIEEKIVQKNTRKNINTEISNNDKSRFNTNKWEIKDTTAQNNVKQKEVHNDNKNLSKSMLTKSMQPHEIKNIKQNDLNQENNIIKNRSMVGNTDKPQGKKEINKNFRDIMSPDDKKQDNDIKLQYKDPKNQISQKKSEELKLNKRRLLEITPLIEKSQIQGNKTSRSTKFKRSSSHIRYASYDIKSLHSIDTKSEKNNFSFNNQTKVNKDFSFDLKKLKKCLELDSNSGIDKVLDKINSNNQVKKNKTNPRNNDNSMIFLNEEDQGDKHITRSINNNRNVNTDSSNLKIQETHSKNENCGEKPTKDLEIKNPVKSHIESPGLIPKEKKHKFKLRKKELTKNHKNSNWETNQHKNSNRETNALQRKISTHKNETSEKNINGPKKSDKGFPFLSEIEEQQSKQIQTSDEVQQKPDNKASNFKGKNYETSYNVTGKSQNLIKLGSGSQVNENLKSNNRNRKVSESKEVVDTKLMYNNEPQSQIHFQNYMFSKQQEFIQQQKKAEEIYKNTNNTHRKASSNENDTPMHIKYAVPIQNIQLATIPQGTNQIPITNVELPNSSIDKKTSSNKIYPGNPEFYGNFFNVNNLDNSEDYNNDTENLNFTNPKQNYKAEQNFNIKEYNNDTNTDGSSIIQQDQSKVISTPSASSLKNINTEFKSDSKPKVDQQYNNFNSQTYSNNQIYIPPDSKGNNPSPPQLKNSHNPNQNWMPQNMIPQPMNMQPYGVIYMAPPNFGPGYAMPVQCAYPMQQTQVPNNNINSNMINQIGNKSPNPTSQYSTPPPGLIEMRQYLPTHDNRSSNNYPIQFNKKIGNMNQNLGQNEEGQDISTKECDITHEIYNNPMFSYNKNIYNENTNIANETQDSHSSQDRDNLSNNFLDMKTGSNNPFYMNNIKQDKNMDTEMRNFSSYPIRKNAQERGDTNSLSDLYTEKIECKLFIFKNYRFWGELQ